MTATTHYNIYLAGYQKSKEVLPLTSWLHKKYLKENIYYLNFGEYTGELFTGTYVSLDNEQGGKENWSKHLIKYFEKINDKELIFALDDYLISEKASIPKIDLGENVCAKLCVCRDDENEEYPITTQYTLWKKEYLLNLLRQVNTPWEFEIEGSKLYRGKVMFKQMLKYPTSSCLSQSWEGIKLDGLNKEDYEVLNNWR